MDSKLDMLKSQNAKMSQILALGQNSDENEATDLAAHGLTADAHIDDPNKTSAHELRKTVMNINNKNRFADVIARNRDAGYAAIDKEHQVENMFPRLQFPSTMSDHADAVVEMAILRNLSLQNNPFQADPEGFRHNPFVFRNNINGSVQDLNGNVESVSSRNLSPRTKDQNARIDPNIDISMNSIVNDCEPVEYSSYEEKFRIMNIGVVHPVSNMNSQLPDEPKGMYE